MEYFPSSIEPGEKYNFQILNLIFVLKKMNKVNIQVDKKRLYFLTSFLLIEMKYHTQSYLSEGYFATGKCTLHPLNCLTIRQYNKERVVTQFLRLNTV